MVSNIEYELCAFSAGMMNAARNGHSDFSHRYDGEETAKALAERIFSEYGIKAAIRSNEDGEMNIANVSWRG